jgi:hypothetical protein
MQFQNSKFLQAEKEIIAETCLVALTAISYILPRRNDLVPVFEESLAFNIDKLLGIGQGQQETGHNITLLRARMSLLLGYYADMIFTKYEDAFVKVVDFLI